MRIRHIGTSLAVIGLAATVSVRAQESREDKFRAWDANRDGRLEMGEMQQNQANFHSMDCNKDGYLTYDEFMNRYQCDGNAASAAPAAPVTPALNATETRFRDEDLNRDGMITRAEWRGNRVAFDRIDRNNDGVVRYDEYSNPPAAGALDSQFDGLDRNNDGIITRGEWATDRATFDRYDRNNDGSVTWSEYANPPNPSSVTARFDEVDRNNDGVISRREWRGEAVDFTTADRNRDDRVTPDEYAYVVGGAAGTGSSTGRFGELDRNNDGTLSRWEWRGETVDFTTADRNRDDRVTPDEYAYVSGGAAATGPYAEIDRRFRVLDRDHNGTVSKGEWRGESVDFRTADRNRDNRVTYDEYRELPTVNTTGYSTARDQRFRELDRNNDGLLTSYEWRGESVAFSTVDRNNDRAVSRDEYMAMGSADDRYRRVSYDPRDERFASEDRNRDSRIARSEWQGERGAFDILDRNRDGYVSAAEYRDRSALADQFASWDSNRDGRLTREEFRYGQQLFDRLDTNNDRLITRDEFLAM